MEHTFTKYQWVWYRFKNEEIDKMEKITSGYHLSDDWIQDTRKNEISSIVVDASKKNKELLYGSLIYHQNIKEKDDFNLVHFYITKDFLITAGLDFHLLQSSDLPMILKQMEEAASPAEGFFILLGEFLNDYLYKIDQFEIRMKDLLWRIQERNDLELLEEIFFIRHELLIWKNLMIPVFEVNIAMQEAFGEKILEYSEAKRVGKRIERCRALIDDFRSEIDTLAKLEEVVSSHRGNEIMKTLTVITMLFTPVMAWGALWGMNFRAMPELKWKYGYLASLIIIVISTIALYLYLKMKGWIGDLLKGTKKNSFFK